MKKLAATAALGLGALTIGAAAGATAEPTAPTPPTMTSGNLQYHPMQYWCSKGIPNYLVAVRAVRTTEKTVTAVQLEKHASASVGPVTHERIGYFFSTVNQAGMPITLTVTGNTTGSTFTVKGQVPATCKGLPTVQPGSTTTPTKPTQPMPTKPMPHKPMPRMPHQPMPTKPMPAGPKVQTDLVAPQSSNNAAAELALGGLAVVAVAGASTVAARRRG